MSIQDVSQGPYGSGMTAFAMGGPRGFKEDMGLANFTRASKPSSRCVIVWSTRIKACVP